MSLDRVKRPALRGSWLGFVLRLLGPIMRIVLGSPLHWPLSRWWLLLRWRGPKTGRMHTIPVSYLREGQLLYVTTGDRWWRRLGESSEVRVRLSGRWRDVRASPVEDRAESLAEHERLFREHAWFRWLAGVPRARRGGPRRGALRRAIEAGRTLVRLELGTGVGFSVLGLVMLGAAPLSWIR